MNIGSIRNITLLNDNPRIGILCAQQRLCSFLGFFFSTRILTRSPPGSSCLRLRTCRICRWGWRCRPSERSPWPQCPELGNHMGLSQNGSKFMVMVLLWFFYGYFMVTLVGKIIFWVPLLTKNSCFQALIRPYRSRCSHCLLGIPSF